MKIIGASCQQIGFIESLIKSTGQASLSARGDGETLWRIQKQFGPVVTIRTWEVLTRGFWPVSIKFEYNNTDDRASISANRKGLIRLKEILPEVFAELNENDNEEELKYERHKKPESEAEGDSVQ